MAESTLPPELEERLEVVKAGPAREAWLLRLLSATMAVLIGLVVGVGALAWRIDRRAERTKVAAEERDAVSAERERAQARALEAFRQLVVATTPEDRAAAREALRAATIPDVTTSTTARRRAVATTSTTRPRATSTTSTSTAAPPSSPSTSAPPPSTTTAPPARPCTTRPVLGCLPTDP